MAKKRYTYVYGYTVSEPDYMVGKEHFFKTQATSKKQADKHFDQFAEGLEDDLGNPVEIELDWLERTTDQSVNDKSKEFKEQYEAFCDGTLYS